MHNNLQLAPTHAALVIIDHFKGQFNDKVLDVLELSNVVVVDVHSQFYREITAYGCECKQAYMRSSFQKWYAHQVKLQNGNHEPVDLRLSVLKPLGAKWFINAFLHIQHH